MKKNFTDLTVVICWCFLALGSLKAQFIWPGDVSNNGAVSATDVLYLGHAFGVEGLGRANLSEDWVAHSMGAPWPLSFPDGTNFAYGDTNGDGKIDSKDFEILVAHLGRTHTPPLNDILRQPDTLAGIPRLRIEAEGIVTRGDNKYLELQILLAKEEGAVDEFYGLAFDIHYSTDQLLPGKVKPSIDTLSWIMRPNEELLALARVDSLGQRISVGLSRVNQEEIVGRGRIMRLRLPVKASFVLENIADLALGIDSIVLLNKAFQSLPIAVDSFSVSPTSCPLTISPVCGIDGTTYLNSCFAEAAGVDFYTSGTCYNPAISVEGMDSTIVCTTAYSPVCGFNYVTYTNTCEAERRGVLVYQEGACGPNDFECYDPNLIVVSNATTVNTITGVVEVNCPSGGEAVLGCDGVVYPNACLAEASGIRSYTSTGTREDCIDYSQIDQDANCDNTVDYVCGCNGYTFVNACYAEAAGITSYTSGPCGGTSSICSEATLIQCGDFLPNQTSIGAGNQIVSYPGFTSAQMLGPDRVYVFQKTTAGDIQIGLEIITPGLDMDIFLLRGDCNNLVCIGASTTSNTVTNNEGIVVRDAPLGTYYIVVDQQYAGPGGNYNLELSCGYLDCTDVVPLPCGEVYQGTNANGNDDVSLYTCGNVLNVENNGPEIVHAFTLTQSGTVVIDLTGLSANLELFLLSSCDRGACMAFSQNAGTANEQIVRTLSAGTYYVVVDGYNGAISDYNLTVSCGAQSCNLSYVPTGTTAANCSQNNGEHNFSIYGGTGTHLATFQGPISGSQVSQNGHFCFVNLVPGSYTTTIQDGSGCTITRTFVVGSNSNMTVSANPLNASCGSQGAIQLSIGGSSPPYTVYLSGQSSATLQSSSSSFTINNLLPGSYTITVVGAGQCSASTTAVIGQSNGNLQFTTSPVPASCGQRGRIGVAVQNGYLNYVVRLQGPVNGTAIVAANNFHIEDVLAGAYLLTITDAYGCTSTESVVVPSIELEAQASTSPSSCGSTGAAQVAISGGVAPYTLHYFGPSSGTISTSNTIVNIPNLASGSYTFSISDNSSCNVTTIAYVNDQGSDLSLNLSQETSSCGSQNAAVQVVVNGGTPNYSLYYSGPVNGSSSLNATGQTMLQLPAGNYTFTVNDFAGCSAVRSISVSPTQNNLSLAVMASSNSCGQASNLTTNISGGTAPYQVSVSNSCGLGAQSFQTMNSQFVLENLSNCTYLIGITDANGCTTSRSVNINVSTEENNLLTLVPVGGNCGDLGYIDIIVDGGTQPYFINWSGPVNGTVNLASTLHRVTNLPAGEYTFSIVTTDGCSQELSTTLNNGGDLTLIPSIVTLECGQYDQIWNDIIGGTPPYTVEVTRLCDGFEETFLNQSNEFELFNLIPCDYKIKVTDANGCMTMNTVRVFPYELFDAVPTPGLCGEPGEIQITITNPLRMPPYSIAFNGPTNGVIQLHSTNVTSLPNLPAGNYTITVTDAGGCTETDEILLQDNPSDLDLLTAIIFDNCGVYNQLWNDIVGGVPPYTIEVIRLCDNSIDTTFTTSGNEFELENLDACDYKVIVTDANGCMDMETRQINPAPANIFTAVPINGPCGQPGRININITGGSGPYQLSYTGPQSGSATVNGTSFSLTGLPAGTYSIRVEDANGCDQTSELSIVVTASDLDLVTSIILNDCGQYNQIWSDIHGGTGPYTVNVIRLCDSTDYANFILVEPIFELYDLPPCDYKITVTDANGCMDMDIATVYPSPVNLFVPEAINGACNDLGSVTINTVAGQAPYTLEITGPLSHNNTLIDASPYTLADLPDGTYTIILRDANDCIQTSQVTIQNTTSDLELATATIFNDCGQYNQLWNDIFGGVGPFTVEVTRLCDNTIDTIFTTNSREFELYNLPPCTYKVKVTDAEGCMAMTTNIIYSTNANLVDINSSTTCEGPSLSFSFIDGTAPYRIVLMGPAGESSYSHIAGPIFEVNNLANGDYMAIITSGEGCTEFDFFSLQIPTGVPPIASFDVVQTTATTYSFNNTSSAGSYSWDFGNGNTSTLASPTIDFGSAGSYNVCLTVTNNCGESTFCEDINVTNGNIMLDIGEVNGTLGQIVNVPITLRGTANLATLAGSIDLAPALGANIIGISPALIHPQFNSSNGSFSYLSENANGISLDPSVNTVLFYLRVELLISEGQIDIFFVDSPVALEISGVMDNGSPSLLEASRGAGRIAIEEISQSADIVLVANDLHGDPINEVAFSVTSALNADETTTYLTNEFGEAYASQMAMGGQYIVNGEKQDDPAAGLSTFSLFVGQRYLLGMEVPQISSPYQLIAADVNCSNSFSTLDLFLIQRLIIGDENNMGNCPPWVFVHESSEMGTILNPSDIFLFEQSANITLMSDTTTHFVGVKRGDILGVANASNLGVVASDRSQTDLPMQLSLPTVGRGDLVSVRINSSDIRGLASLQFQLAFDDQALEYLGFSESDLGPTALVSDRLADRGLLRLAWFSESGYGLAADNGQLLSLQFRAKADIDDWRGLLALENQGFPAEAYRDNTEALKPVLEVYTQQQDVAAKAFAVEQNQPNPFSGTTQIRFQLPEASWLSLRITDALGRQVLERKQYYEAGAGQLDLDLNHLSPGLYYYRVQAKENIALLPMLMLR